MESNRLARQSSGLLKICKDRVLFELYLWKKVRKKRKKMNKIKIFKLFYSNLFKVSGTFGVDIALD